MLWTAFFLGILGSWHCLGMCGPIVLALPVYTHHPLKLIGSRLLYNSGRIVTYGILGLLVGLIGEGIALAGIQQNISIIAGILIIVFSIFSIKQITTRFNWGLFHLSNLVKQSLGRFLKRKGVSASLVVGLANGFLPCGLVYIAIGGALATGDWKAGMFYMILFGGGTSIAMFTLGILGNFVGLKVKASFNRIIPYVAVIMGVLLILRGMNLGIPYVSPMLNDTVDAALCH